MRKEKLVEFGRRVTAKLEEKKMTLQDFAKAIDKSYEMARRYARGWALPDDPKTLELIAKALGTSVGHLMADEQDASPLPPLFDASDIKEPISQPVRMLVEDEAMLTTVDNIRLFGIGDQVILYPQRRPLPGDIVALRVKDTTTLRKLVESEGTKYVPKKEGYATYTNGTVLGIVAGVYGKVARFE